MRTFAINKRERIDKPSGWHQGVRDEVDKLVARMCEQKPCCPHCEDQEVGVIPERPMLLWNCEACGHVWKTDWNLNRVDVVEVRKCIAEEEESEMRMLVRQFIIKVRENAVGNRKLQAMLDAKV
jgi:ribosomal protein L37AE/L43A